MCAMPVLGCRSSPMTTVWSVCGVILVAHLLPCSHELLTLVEQGDA